MSRWLRRWNWGDLSDHGELGPALHKMPVATSVMGCSRRFDRMADTSRLSRSTDINKRGDFLSELASAPLTFDPFFDKFN
jgi:hypothetical protein